MDSSFIILPNGFGWQYTADTWIWIQTSIGWWSHESWVTLSTKCLEIQAFKLYSSPVQGHQVFLIEGLLSVLIQIRLDQARPYRITNILTSQKHVPQHECSSILNAICSFCHVFPSLSHMSTAWKEVDTMPKVRLRCIQSLASHSSNSQAPYRERRQIKDDV